MTADETGYLCFVDSNLWIYAVTQPEDSPPDPRHEIARQIIAQIQPCLSVQVVNEVTANLLRKFRFSELEIRILIQSFFRKYAVFGLDAVTITRASRLRETYQFSFWDSLIIASALQQGCSTVYSEDMQHRLVIEETLTIINPFFEKPPNP